MSNRKREQHDTAAAQVAGFAAAAKQLKPTQALRGVALTAFQEIISSRETATWMAHDLRIATELAKIMARLTAVTDMLEEEEPVLYSTRGTPVTNPLYSVAMQLSSTVQAMGRALGLAATVKGLSTGDQAPRNRADAEARETLERAAHAEGLL